MEVSWSFVAIICGEIPVRGLFPLNKANLYSYEQCLNACTVSHALSNGTHLGVGGMSSSASETLCMGSHFLTGKLIFTGYFLFNFSWSLSVLSIPLDR